MAMTKLPTDFKDSITEQYKYKLTEADTDEYLLDDVSEYSEEGSYFGANEINLISKTINENVDIINGNSDILNKVISGTIPMSSALETGIADYAPESDEAKQANTSNDMFALETNAILDFKNKVCTFADSRITENSLADVYFEKQCIDVASKSVISVNTRDGYVDIVAGRTPSSPLTASIYIKVV